MKMIFHKEFSKHLTANWQQPWIQNVAEPRRNVRVGKVLELGDPRFHVAIAAIWNAIAILEQLCRTATETEITTETAFWILDNNVGVNQFN